MVCDACPTTSSAIWKTIVVIGVTNAIAVSCFLYFVIFFLSAVQVFYLNGKPVIIYHQGGGSEGLCNILMNPSPYPHWQSIGSQRSNQLRWRRLKPFRSP